VLLGYLQNRDASINPQNMVLTLQNHIADPVGGWIGGNPSTGGTIPGGSSNIKELINALLGKENTSHNCYGNANSSACNDLWGRSSGAPVGSKASGRE
jgi:filamentous hemagglutinin